MLGNFAVYMRNGFGFRKAFRFAFGITVRDFILNLITILAIIGALTALCINGMDMLDKAQAERSAEQAAYKKTVESILDACLSDATGRPITIDGEVYLCGIVPIGVKV